ncbi:MAG: glycoside hydrolase family 2 TIM barrel-domain containing protein, partial [Janthinobacterium lividum]
MKILIAAFVLSFCLQISAWANPSKTVSADTIGKTDFPTEIENPEILGINKQPTHATLMPYANLKEALTGNRRASSFARSLNGNWKFNWVAWPKDRPADFYKTGYDVSCWKNIPVPSNWEIHGYGTPSYRNIGYTFKIDFPKVMSTPPETYTAFKERNPVGSYRRNFDVPANWSGGRIFITFDGVDSGFFLWINGQKVGYSVNSRNAAEFDITNYVKPGKNMVAAEVYQYNSGSYLEDQDMWRLHGIFRNVTLWKAPEEHIRDFFIKTDLDNQYKDATALISAKIKNFGTQKTALETVSATIYDNDNKIIAVKTASVSALNANEEVKVDLNLQVSDPLKWTAETPNLYTAVIQIKQNQKVTETISQKIGFREIEIKGRLFLVNGVPIKLKGVNRHENWPEVGHAITEDQMRRDLEVIKQGNCNHIRTCHYSDDPRWYELCDKYGIYLVAEANVEAHGLMNKLNEEPRIKAAIVDRNRANVESFKNHPSVIIWSLGNEFGTGGSNFLAALNTVKSIDTTRPTHYEGFGVGEKNPADIDSKMYPPIIPYADSNNLKKKLLSSLERAALDPKLTKPFYLCEFAHAMFNSMGSLKEYNDLFDKYPQLLGGAIWEFQDQGIWNRRDPQHPRLAFGGGFGEFPNDHYFIHKGTVFSDRSLKPHYPEMKHEFQWIGIKAVDLAKGTFTIRNKYQFIDLSGFSGKWEITKNGVKDAEGELDLGEIKPTSEKIIKIPYDVSRFEPGAVYHVRLSFNLKKEELWAKKGYEIAAEQFEFPVVKAGAVFTGIKTAPLSLLEANNKILVKGKNFQIEFDKTSGTIAFIQNSGQNLLNQNGGPMLHLWRAPHRNDDIWADKEWEDYGLKDLKWTAKNVVAKQVSPTEIMVSADLSATGKKDFSITHHVVYTVFSDGKMVVNNEVKSSVPKLNLARMGVRMFLSKDYQQFSYFGRGPMENYSDRKSGSEIGLYNSSVLQQLTPYEKPMECGNHEDVRWAKLINNAGNGLEVKSSNSLLQVSALPYSDEELAPVEYRIDLPASKATVLCVSYKTLGVGSNSCGPTPM